MYVNMFVQIASKHFTPKQGQHKQQGEKGEGEGRRKAAQQKFKKKKTVQIKLFAFVGFASLHPAQPPLAFLLWQKTLPRVNAKLSVASGKWQAQN